MELLIILVLILLNGLFSMSEIALVSSRKFKLENAAKRGNVNAKRALDMANSPATFLSTVQIGITLIGILTGIFSGEKITADVQSFVERFPALMPYAHPVSVGVVVVIITYFSIVFGELIPKRIGLIFPETIATIVSIPMYLVSVVARPFIWLLTRTSDLFFYVFRIRQSSDSKITEEEIKSIIQEGTEEGEIQEIEQNIVERVFALGDRKVAALMTHRTDIIWLDISDSFDDVRQKVSERPHSIYPVGNGEIDHVTGVASIKDLFINKEEEKNFQLKDYLREAFFIPGNTPAYSLLERFKEKKTHYALIADEYGTLQGLITMDDLLDALVGDASELHHEDEYSIFRRDDGTWLADGQYPYFEFLHYFNMEDDDEGRFNTLAGLMIDELKKIPATGEKLVWRDLELEVIDMDGNRIDKILIKDLSGER